MLHREDHLDIIVIIIIILIITIIIITLMSVAVTQSCSTGLFSKSSALGLSASVENAILAPSSIFCRRIYGK